jgi:DNA invertase Pin-like site-specific DNA recombinase
MNSHGEKVRAGQDRARTRGVRMGRPRNPRITGDVLTQARAMLIAGASWSDVATALRLKKTTLFRALHRDDL